MVTVKVPAEVECSLRAALLRCFFRGVLLRGAGAGDEKTRWLRACHDSFRDDLFMSVTGTAVCCMFYVELRCVCMIECVVCFCLVCVLL